MIIIFHLPNYKKQSSAFLTATATKLSEVTVRRIMAEYNKENILNPPLRKGSNPYAINEGVKTTCQDIIRSHNILREHLSLRLLVGILNDKHNIEVARETLRETLRAYLYRWQILHGSVQRHTALREQDYVVKARREYLIKKRELNASNRELVFQAKKFTSDYHGSMNEENFTKWFTTQLLPNIPDNSVIIMDNAPYHNTFKEDGVPQLTSKKVVF